MRVIDERIIAMSAQFQAAHIVHNLALGKPTPTPELSCLLQALYTFNTTTSHELYPLRLLRPGLETVIEFLSRKWPKSKMPIFRYAFGFSTVAKLILKDPIRSQSIRDHLKKHEYQLQHFDVTHPNVLGNLSDLYLKTISTLPKKIFLVGHKDILSQAMVLQKIRATLLAGIRAGVQWRLQGGRGWHCLVHRTKLLQRAHYLLALSTDQEKNQEKGEVLWS
jgi:high frequency lysogenization protein